MTTVWSKLNSSVRNRTRNTLMNTFESAGKSSQSYTTEIFLSIVVLYNYDRLSNFYFLMRPLSLPTYVIIFVQKKI